MNVRGNQLIPGNLYILCIWRRSKEGRYKHKLVRFVSRTSDGKLNSLGEGDSYEFLSANGPLTLVPHDNVLCIFTGKKYFRATFKNLDEMEKLGIREDINAIPEMETHYAPDFAI